MNILNRMKKIPGGLLIIPMIIAAIINTFFPEALQIGNPTTALLTSKGTMVLIGLMLFISGTQFKANQVKGMLKRSGILCITKLAIVYLIGIILNKYFGVEGIFGISTLAIIAVLASCNPGLYIALINNYGDEIDASAFGLLNLIVVPAIPIVILNSTSGQGIQLSVIIATLIPFILGAILGNLDDNFKRLYEPGTVMLLPFMGICFGANINIKVAIEAGIGGVAITAIYYLVSFLPLLFVDISIVKRRGYAAAAMSSVAGLSLVVPTLATELSDIYAPFQDTAIAQIACAVILTTIITPIITKAIANKVPRRKRMLEPLTQFGDEI